MRIGRDYLDWVLDLNTFSSEREELDFVPSKRYATQSIYLLRHFPSQSSLLWNGLLFSLFFFLGRVKVK